MDNVEITVPKGKTLEFIICDYGTIKDYDNVVLKNITIKGGGQVSFISGGSIAVNSIKSVDNSRILFIANKNLSLSDPLSMQINSLTAAVSFLRQVICKCW